MLLDPVIAFLGTLGTALVWLVRSFVNLLSLALEALLGLIFHGFKIPRWAPAEIQGQQTKRGKAQVLTGGIPLVILIGILLWIFVVPAIQFRQITLRAPDGQTLPYAALIIHSKEGDQHQRSDSLGQIRIPRFRTEALSIDDPRYEKKTWQKSELRAELTVPRSLLGSSLDHVLERLRPPPSKSSPP